MNRYPGLIKPLPDHIPKVTHNICFNPLQREETTKSLGLHRVSHLELD